MQRSINRTTAFLAFFVMLVAVAPSVTSAAPIVVPVGDAQASLQFLPDPPGLGKVRAIVTVSSGAQDATARTTLSYTTEMQSMSMPGPTGTAQQVAPNRWEFDPIFESADMWEVRLRFAGGLDATVVYHVPVGQSGSASGSAIVAAAAQPPAAAPVTAAKPSTRMPAGDQGAWRTAAIAAIAVVAIAFFVIVIRGDRRPLTIGVAVGAAALVGFLGLLDARYAPVPMDMAAMASVRGNAPTPVTVATIRPDHGDRLVFAPARSRRTWCKTS